MEKHFWRWPHVPFKADGAHLYEAAGEDQKFEKAHMRFSLISVSSDLSYWYLSACTLKRCSKGFGRGHLTFLPREFVCLKGESFDIYTIYVESMTHIKIITFKKLNSLKYFSSVNGLPYNKHYLNVWYSWWIFKSWLSFLKEIHCWTCILYRKGWRIDDEIIIKMDHYQHWIPDQK